MTDWRRILVQVCPHAHGAVVAMIADRADEQFARWKIDTAARQAHLLGHMAVETSGFTTLEENLNYSSSGLRRTFPTHFTEAQAEQCAHNPRAIAIRAYGGRMGNRPGTDDGWTFRGSGGLQCTGRDNIGRLAEKLGVSAETAAAWLRDPEHMLECACALFVMLGCLPFADQGLVHAAITSETRHVNGGLNGLADREAEIGKFARALGAGRGGRVGLLGDAGSPAVALSAGRIKAVQEQLKAKGYWAAGACDGVMGPATGAALFHFQSDAGLDATGTLDEATEDALWRAGARVLPDTRTAATEDDLRQKGSQTIAAADDASDSGGKVVAGGLLAGGGTLVETVSSLSDKASSLRDTVSNWSDLSDWFSGHWMQVVLLGIAAAVAYEGWRAIKAARRVRRLRTADHNSGANMGR